MVDYKLIFYTGMLIFFLVLIYFLSGWADLLETVIFIVVAFSIIHYFDLLSGNFFYAFVPCFLLGVSDILFGLAGFFGCAVFIVMVLSVLRYFNRLPGKND